MRTNKFVKRTRDTNSKGMNLKTLSIAAIAGLAFCVSPACAEESVSNPVVLVQQKPIIYYLKNLLFSQL